MIIDINQLTTKEKEYVKRKFEEFKKDPRYSWHLDLLRFSLDYGVVKVLFARVDGKEAFVLIQGKTADDVWRESIKLLKEQNIL